MMVIIKEEAYAVVVATMCLQLLVITYGSCLLSDRNNLIHLFDPTSSVPKYGPSYHSPTTAIGSADIFLQILVISH